MLFHSLATPPMIEMEDYQVYGSPLSQGLRQRHHRGRRSRQKAIISSLIKILMEPGSPLESEEETELWVVMELLSISVSFQNPFKLLVISLFM